MTDISFDKILQIDPLLSNFALILCGFVKSFEKYQKKQKR